MSNDEDLLCALFAAAVEVETNSIATHAKMTVKSFDLLFTMSDQVAQIGNLELTDLARAMTETVTRGACLSVMPEQHYSFSGSTRSQVAYGFVLILTDLNQYFQKLLAFRGKDKLDSRKARRLKRELRSHYDLRCMASPPPPPPLEPPGSINELWFPNAFSPLYGVIEVPDTWPSR